jgi:hypothetical protein
MIIVRISGGLGNQLFQYAYGRSMAIKNTTELKLDISSLKNTERAFGLDVFTIKASLAEPLDYKKVGIVDVSKQDFFSKIQKKLIELLEENKPNNQKKIIREAGFTFNADLMEISGDHYVVGLWQSEKYFSSFRSDILSDLTLKNPLSPAADHLKSDMVALNSVSIHIRRGDYVSNAHTNQKHGVCPPEYYARTIEHITKHVSNPHFFVFSDDIAWVKENLKLPSQTTYVSGSTTQAHEELMLMSFCKHNIIANSSFSWWGAWLNQNPAKIVIAPKQWFATSTIETKDLIPLSWVQL